MTVQDEIFAAADDDYAREVPNVYALVDLYEMVFDTDEYTVRNALVAWGKDRFPNHEYMRSKKVDGQWVEDRSMLSRTMRFIADNPRRRAQWSEWAAQRS